MKHEIEIPGLPEGYIAVAYRLINADDELIFYDGKIRHAQSYSKSTIFLIVEKIKPRERKFVCVSESKRTAVVGEWYEPTCGDLILCSKPETQDKYIIWREVKEES